MFHRSHPGVLVTLVLALQLASCGGGGGGGGGEDPPANRAPAASAGADQAVFKAASVTLDGGGTDADGHPLTYRWTQTAGTPVDLNSATVQRPTFAAPAVSGALTFSLVVNDGRVDSAADSVTIAVNNRAPIANAGADADIDVSTLHSLSAMTSMDPDGDSLTYAWTQIAGPTVSLVSVGTGGVQFVSPVDNARLEFALVANDGETDSPQDVVVVNVTARLTNSPPIVYTTPVIEAPKRSRVNLYAYAFDPDGLSVTYRWRQLSGPSVTLIGASSADAYFTGPADAANYLFELMVTDSLMAATVLVIEVAVRNQAPMVDILGLTPFNPRTDDDLEVEAQAFDADGDPVTLSYTWTRNGVAVPGITGTSFPASLTTRDDIIEVTIAANDGTDVTLAPASVTIQDTPPILSATPPTQVAYGDDVAFTVTTGSDPDGDDPGPMVVRLGPAGFTVDSAGSATWRAHLPMFEDAVDVAWSVGLRDYPEAVIEGVIRVADSARQLPLIRSGSTHPQNSEHLVVTDLDGDGVDDILVSDGRTLGSLALSGSDFVQDWGHPFSLSGPELGVTAIEAGDVDGDGHAEIFVSTDGKVLKLDGESRRQTHEFLAANLRQCLSLRLADLEGDGAWEIVCLATTGTYGWDGGTTIHILNAADLSEKARIDQTGLGRNLAIGNVDPDAALEIVTAGGYVYDGATRQNEWAYGPRFGDYIDLGDLDGNGIDEIVAAGSTAPQAFSVVLRSPIGEITGGANYGQPALLIGNLDADASEEVILGDAQWGNVSVYRYDGASQTFSLAAQMNSQDHSVSAIRVGNVDADPAIEIVWDSGYTSSGADVFVVAEFTSPGTLALQWSSAIAGEFDGPFVGGALTRTSPTSRSLMFVSPTTESGYGGARLFAMDASGGTASSPQVSNNAYSSTSLTVADFDGDLVEEVFLSSSSGYNPYFQAYDFQGGTAEWTSSFGFGMSRAMKHEDFNGDSRPDLAVFHDDRRITLFNPAGSTILWQSTQLGGGSAMDMDIGDVTGDGLIDLVALTDSFLFIYSRNSAGAPFLELRNVPVSYGSHVLLADADGNGTSEIYVVTAYSYSGESVLRVYDTSLQLQRSMPLMARITNLALEPGSQPRKNLLIATDDTSNYYWHTAAAEIWAIDALSGAGVWRSPRLPGTLSRHSLYTPDIDSDGQYELSFGTTVGAFLTR
jgi:hypothetical protein